MKTFIKKHKIFITILIILLILFLLVGTAFGFMVAKLNKLDYHDGKISSSEVETTVGEEVESEALGETEELLEENENLVSDEEAAVLGEGEAVHSEDEIKSDENVFNILLLGTDGYAEEFTSKARADSIMLLSLNKKDKTMKLVSLQRGMGIPIPYGKYEGQYDWLTHLFRYGGADMMMQAVRDNFKVDVQYYVRVNFHTFEKLIDSVGGVDVELTEIETQALNDEIKTNAIAKNKVHVGMNHLDGYDALQYSRLRYTDSDWKRVQRQRNVIQSVVSAAGDMSLLDINAMLDTILPLIQTNLTTTDILGLVGYAPAVLGCEFEQMTIPAKDTYGSMKGMGGRNVYAVDFKQNSKILQDFLYGAEK